MEERVARIGLTALSSIALHYLGSLTPAFFMMIIFAIVDYITGMAAAKWYPSSETDGWSSREAFKGFFKKVSYIILVGVTVGVDYLIIESGGVLGIVWDTYFSLFATSYLILSEAVSIIENISKMGVNIPFLTSALKVFREKIENRGGGGK